MIMATKIKKRSPKKELNTWLPVYRSWDHTEWTNLLQNLSNQGFHELCAPISWQKSYWFLLGN